KLGAMRDDAAVFLRHARQKSRHVFKRYEGNVEAITEADKPRTLNRRRDIQHTREKCRLVSDNPDRTSAQTCEANTDIGRKHLLHFEEVTIIDNRVNNVA